MSDGAPLEALKEIYSGVTVGTSHSVYFLKKWMYRQIFRPALVTFGFPVSVETQPIEKLPDGQQPKLQVVGVGYGRTGTYSLALALDELGFPTLHTQHLYEMDQIFDMWSHDIILPSIDANEAILGHPDFDLIASYGFTGTSDLPMALYFEELVEKYPDCKFILTVRENSEVWFKSWDMLTKSITQPTRYAHFLTGVRRLGFYLRWLFSIINKDNSYLTVPYPLPDQNKEAAIASYEEHNRRVREVIPPERLLEYSVKEGWDPLCNFLKVEDCPMTPFPKTNSARSVRVQSISAVIVPLMCVLFVGFYLVSFLFQRVTKQTIIGWLNNKVAQLMDAMTPKEMRPEMRRREHRNAKLA